MANPTLSGMSTTAIPRGKQFKDRLYIWNGVNAMRKFDGVAFYLAGIAALRAPSGAKPSVATSGAVGAGKLTGKYKYLLAAGNSKMVNALGQPVVSQMSLLSDEIKPQGQNITVANIPATHADPQVDRVYIYRNKADQYLSGAGPQDLAFYQVGFVTLGTTTYTDSLIDDGLSTNDQIRYFQAIPPSAKYGEIFGDRLFIAGFDTIATGTATLNTKTITTKAVTSNLATITTSAAHGYAAGQVVTVATTSKDPVFDGARYIVTAPTTTTFTFDVDNANVVSVAETGTTQVVDFAGVTLPDGIVGCKFQATADATVYLVAAMNSTTEIALDQAYIANPTALTAVAYSIFRPRYHIYHSEYYDFEAWGPPIEGQRWRKEVPGLRDVTGLLTFQEYLIVFTATDIYTITGKGPNPTDIHISAQPVFAGIGCVSGDTICLVDNEIYFLSLRGLCRMGADLQPQLIGQVLRTDFLDSLNMADLAISCGGTNGRYVWFSVVNTTGDTENSVTYRYDRYTGGFWKETGAYYAKMFNDQLDGGGLGPLFAIQGANIVQLNSGSTDWLTAVKTGTITSTTTTSFTDSTAAFPTTLGSMVEATVMFFRTTGNIETYLGSRRIVSNTATAGTWSVSAVGGGSNVFGSFTLQVGDTYVIGAIRWMWRSRTLSNPLHIKRITEAVVEFNQPDGATATNFTLTQYADNTVESNAHKVSAQQLTAQKFDTNLRCNDYYAVLESRDGAVIKSFAVKLSEKGDNK